MDPESRPHQAPARESDPAALAALAAQWVEKRDRGLEPSERRDLQSWLSANPKHAAAFAQADTARTEFDWPLHSGTVDRMLMGLEACARRRRTRRQTLAGVGFALVLMLALIFVRRSVTPPESGTPRAGSGLIVLAPQKRILPDGSVVELKDGAAIQVDYTKASRLVILAAGTAHFQVAKNSAWPFIVKAQD